MGYSGPVLSGVQDADNSDRVCEKVLQELVEEHHVSAGMVFPRPVIWLSGAPGSGKGANSCHVMRALGISSEPIVVSELLDTDDLQSRKDRGDLVDNSIVVRATFLALLRGKGGEGLVMDGYPRSLFQAKFLYLLERKLRALSSEDPQFRVIVFSVDEATSLERQLSRGRKAIAYNQEVKQTGNGALREVRSTDVDEVLARRRYKNFLSDTEVALRYLQSTDIPFVEIDSRGSFDDVKKRIVHRIKR
ncbi:MAG: nucleoside monophosphate kinase [Puniceicoccales bacterium]|nr:nucleoside monophosphate kinase [Puniceicoccales bacterium]